jgi:membrane-associated phospholipid phosphatase
VTASLRKVPLLAWGLLAFVVLILLRAGPRAFTGLDVIANSRNFNILEAAIIVAVIRLWGLFRAEPWPQPAARARRIWSACALLVFTPLALMAFEAATGQREKIAQMDTAASTLNYTINAVVSALGLNAPIVALWLAVGLQLKSPRGFEAHAFASALARGLWLVLTQLGPLIVIISGYAWMEGVIAQPATTSDAALAAADRALFGGHDPIALLQPIISRPLSEWMSFSYSFYAFLYPVAVGAIFYGSGARGLEEVSFAVGIALLLGYASFTIFPAVGPQFTQVYEVPLDLYYTKEVKEALMDRLRIPYDCFPSMHTATSLLLSFCCWRRARVAFWATLPMVATIPFACIYLRYHYVVDVLAGGVVFAVLALVTRRLFSRQITERSGDPAAVAALAPRAGPG